MSHSKGFFSSCPGNFVNYRKPREGIQNQKCNKCGQLRQVKVRPCFLFHDWGSWGKSSKGFKQKRKCRRCGQEQDRRTPSCFFHRGWRRVRNEPGILQCTRCGEKRKITQSTRKPGADPQ